VRELENEIERLVTLAEGGQLLQAEQLSAKFTQPKSAIAGSAKIFCKLRDAIDDLEKQMILAAQKISRQQSQMAAASA
jgi:transcriptional regulator with PAS, ATPase and Fis domain